MKTPKKIWIERDGGHFYVHIKEPTHYDDEQWVSDKDEASIDVSEEHRRILFNLLPCPNSLGEFTLTADWEPN